MSRIQEILNKAEREGTARRTRGLSEATSAAPTVPPAHLRAPAAVLEPAPVPWTAGATAPVLEPDDTAMPSPVFDGHLVAAVAPQSPAAERYRLLRTRIKQSERGRSVRSIVVTSPAKGDGKSLTAANLALTMAQEFHQRVLLLDADLRRPSVARLFGISDGPGLTDVLMGVADLDSALVHLRDHHLTILPAGTPPAQPAELLGSASMRRVLDTLGPRYDRILIDMPPVAPLADVHVLSQMADGLLMIVRAGSTPKPAIERALSGLDMTKVLGLVLNGAGDGGGDGYSDGYGYIAG
ncbi:MAG TPA: CpsD/CapB family tyrosine-protein kinase [Vicinamibacterales bacterium]|nr:CpsD/CapB family tyrosine-protein kinase [Vicinamibacterales bacterium]